MNQLLEEILDFDDIKNYLSFTECEKYKYYLRTKLLQEYRTEDLYKSFIISKNTHKDVAQRIQSIVGQFLNTKYFEKDKNTNCKVPAVRTNLQLKNGTYCTKKEFEDEFLKYEFATKEMDIESRKLMKAITNLFDDNGWLKHCI